MGGLGLGLPLSHLILLILDVQLQLELHEAEGVAVMQLLCSAGSYDSLVSQPGTRPNLDYRRGRFDALAPLHCKGPDHQMVLLSTP